MSKLNKINKRGFTLVEILVVILIIGILFVAFLPRIDFAGDKARETGVKSSLRSYMVASEQLLREYAGFKDDDNVKNNALELNKLLDASNRLKVTEDTTTPGKAIIDADGIGKISGNAIKTNEEDPWKENYEVEFIKGNGTERKIVVASWGKTQTTGTADYLLLTTYKDGVIKSCTAGLNVNIGVVMNGATKIEGQVKASDYANLTCGD